MPKHSMAATGEVAGAIPLNRSSLPRGEAIYVMTAAEYLKVGVSKDIRSRMETLQTGSPRLLALRAMVSVERPYQIEQAVHRALATQRTDGGEEWLADVEPLGAVRIVTSIADALGREATVYYAKAGLTLNQLGARVRPPRRPRRA